MGHHKIAKGGLKSRGVHKNMENDIKWQEKYSILSSMIFRFNLHFQKRPQLINPASKWVQGKPAADLDIN